MMNNRSRRDFLGWVLAAAGVAALPACRPATEPGLAPGDPFPAVTLPDLAGRPVLLDTAGDTALLVNFWATWCAPCRREMPSLQRLSALFDPAELRLVVITVDEDLNLVREFQLRYQIDFELLSDREQKFAKDRVGVAGFPMTYLITRAGVVAQAIPGERNWTEEAMLREIEQALDVRRRA